MHGHVRYIYKDVVDSWLCAGVYTEGTCTSVQTGQCSNCRFVQVHLHNSQNAENYARLHNVVLLESKGETQTTRPTCMHVQAYYL